MELFVQPAVMFEKISMEVTLPEDPNAWPNEVLQELYWRPNPFPQIPSGKLCVKCHGAGPFSRNKSNRDGLQKLCKSCMRQLNQQRYQRKKEWICSVAARLREKHPERAGQYPMVARRRCPERLMWVRCRGRALRKGIEFNLDVSDIVIPSHCPLLGIPLFYGKGSVGRNSPTVDRKDPKKGYVKGNVWVISHKANAMKNDATLEELELLVQNLWLHTTMAATGG